MMRGLLGLAALLGIAWLLSEDRRRIPWRTVFTGLLLQWALALLLLYFPPASKLIGWLNDGATALQAATEAGTSFVFGYLGGGAAAVRRDAARRQLHPGLPCTAAGADNQRARLAAVLLGHPAADHRGLRLGVAPRDGHRRRARLVRRCISSSA